MNAKHAFILFFSLLLTLPRLAEAAEARHDCGTETQGATRFRYCIDTPANPSGEILWYFHGAFGSEHYWHDAEENGSIRKTWEDRRVAEPTVISISRGKVWLMTLENQVYPDFVERILPALEAKAGGLHGRRLLLGFSLGGFNASQLLFRNGALFERVGLVSPAFLTVGPYSSPNEVDAYIERNRLGLSGEVKVKAFLDVLKQNFRTPAAWIAHDPLELIQGKLLPGTNLYVSAADEDNYGFHEGATVFVQAASSRGVAMQWDSLHGGHRTIHAAALAEFFMPRAPALE